MRNFKLQMAQVVSDHQVLVSLFTNFGADLRSFPYGIRFAICFQKAGLAHGSMSAERFSS